MPRLFNNGNTSSGLLWHGEDHRHSWTDAQRIRSVTAWLRAGSCTQTTSLPPVAFFSLKAMAKRQQTSNSDVTDLGMKENWGFSHKSETTRMFNNVHNNNSSHNNKSTTVLSANRKVIDRGKFSYMWLRKSLISSKPWTQRFCIREAFPEKLLMCQAKI